MLKGCKTQTHQLPQSEG